MLKIESLKEVPRDLFMKKPFLRIVFLIVLEFFLSILIDPYIEIVSPFQNILINSLLPLFFLLILYFLTLRIVLSLFLVNFIHLLFVLINFKKTEILNSNIIYYDLILLPQYLEGLHLVFGFIITNILFLILGLSILIGIFYLIFKYDISFEMKTKFRILILICTILIFYYGNKKIGRTVAVELPIFKWSAFNQVNGASSVGVMGNIELGYLLSNHELKKSKPKKIDLFWNDPLLVEVPVTPIEVSVKPDIILIQSESLVDPGDLKGIHSDYALNYIRASINREKQGYLIPPVLGGYTLQTEFEVLTGISTHFFGSRAAYYDLPLDTVVSLPKVMNKNNYRTVALHPNDKKYWNREIAFKKLGFSQFKDLDHYWQWKDERDFKNTHNLVSDFTLVKSIITELEISNQPSLIFAISLGNHGPWGMFGDTLPVQLNLQEKQKKIIVDYLHSTQEVDDSFKILLNYLKNRKRPTLLIFYSDHLPGFGEIFDALPFKNNRSPVLQGVPLFVWSSYSLPYSLPEYLPSYLLGGWILKASGIPAENQFIGSQKLCDTMQLQRESYETILNKYEPIWDNYKHMSGYFLTHSK
jgi:phosphoglycerol transferase MdoB-like AlkP superfamily enzyme